MRNPYITVPALGCGPIETLSERFGQGLTGKERVAWVTAILAGVA